MVNNSRDEPFGTDFQEFLRLLVWVHLDIPVIETSGPGFVWSHAGSHMLEGYPCSLHEGAKARKVGLDRGILVLMGCCRLCCFTGALEMISACRLGGHLAD